MKCDLFAAGGHACLQEQLWVTIPNPALPLGIAIPWEACCASGAMPVCTQDLCQPVLGI